jgi:hypothetical protein
VFHLGHVFTKQFLLTLTVGVAFGLSFAFMILNATSLNRTDMFLGPPPAKYSMDVHDHEVSLTVTYGSVPGSQVSKIVFKMLENVIFSYSI